MDYYAAQDRGCPDGLLRKVIDEYAKDESEGRFPVRSASEDLLEETALEETALEETAHRWVGKHDLRNEGACIRTGCTQAPNDI